MFEGLQYSDCEKNACETHIVSEYDTQKMLRDGESNPGLPRDRRGYSPLYYRGVYLNAYFEGF